MKDEMTIQVYSDKAGKKRWRFIAANHEQLAKSPRGYDTQEDLTEDLAEVLAQNWDAELYRDRKGEWRWRLSHSHHGKRPRILAISSEGYHNRRDCKHASDLVLDSHLVAESWKCG